MSGIFTALYRSVCGECDEPIRPGDEVGYVDDEFMCASCVGGGRAPVRTVAVCSTCHLTGPCDCEPTP